MEFLASKNHWRDTFKDQLNINFQEWLIGSVAQNISNKVSGNVHNNELATEQILKMGVEKEPIKRKVQFDL